MKTTTARRIALAAVAAAGFGAATVPAAEAAPTWTQVPSNTSEDITAMEYRGPGQHVIATGGGKILRNTGGGFAQELSVPGVTWNDLEFDRTGQYGVAVGTGGAAYRTSNYGDTWVSLGSLPAKRTRCDGTTYEPAGNLKGAAWAGDNTLYIFAEHRAIYRSANARTGSASSFAERNQPGPGFGCRVEGSVVDAAFITENSGYLLGFGVHKTEDGVGSPALNLRGVGSGIGDLVGIELDPASPNRVWWSQAENSLHSTDGAQTGHNLDLRNASESGIEDITFAGGSVLLAGRDGVLTHSADGEVFHPATAPAPFAQHDWRAADALDANHAAVAGAGGVVLVTQSLANVPVPVAAAPAPAPSRPAATTPTQPRPTSIRPSDSTTAAGSTSSIVAAGQRITLTLPGRCVSRGDRVTAQVRTRSLRRTSRRRIQKVTFKVGRTGPSKVDRRHVYRVTFGTTTLRRGRHVVTASVKYRGVRRVVRLTGGFEVC